MIVDRKVLACAMIDKGYNAVELAEAAGVKPVTVGRAKRGISIRETSFMKICKALDLKAKDLLAD